MTKKRTFSKALCQEFWSPGQFRAQARVMKALAHSTRIFIVDELSHGERCVAELTGMIGAEMPTVSRHLKLLKNAGLVAAEKRGANVFYRLRLACCLNFLKCVESVLAQDRAGRRSAVG